MKSAVLVVVGSVLLGGCAASSTLKLENGLLIEEAGQTNLFRPSLSVMQVSKCVEQEGVTTVIDIDGNSHTCYGKYVPIAVVQGTQAGSMTGLGGAMIQGGAIVGGAYLLADGIRDSGDRTTNTNNTSSEGGDSASLSSNRNDNLNLNTNAAQGGAGGNGYGFGGAGGKGGSVNYGKHRR